MEEIIQIISWRLIYCQDHLYAQHRKKLVYLCCISKQESIVLDMLNSFSSLVSNNLNVEVSKIPEIKSAYCPKICEAIHPLNICISKIKRYI